MPLVIPTPQGQSLKLNAFSGGETQIAINVTGADTDLPAHNPTINIVEVNLGGGAVP